MYQFWLSPPPCAHILSAIHLSKRRHIAQIKKSLSKFAIDTTVRAAGAESASAVQLSSSLTSGLQSRYIPVLWVPAINSVWLVSSGLVQHNFAWMFRLNILRCDKRENRLWGLRYCFQLWLRERKFGIGCTAATECAHALHRLWNPAFRCVLAKLLLQNCLEKFFCLLKCVRRLQKKSYYCQYFSLSF